MAGKFVDRGCSSGLDELMPEVYDELHQLAKQALRQERREHTLQPSALVNEVYLRLGLQGATHWQSRAHFFAAAAETIRRILIEHARKHHAQKRAGGRQRIAIDDVAGLSAANSIDLLELNGALDSLFRFDPRLGRVVQLRFFGGLTMDEVAGVLGLSKRTIENDWTIARAWLRRELGHESTS